MPLYFVLAVLLAAGCGDGSAVTAQADAALSGGDTAPDTALVQFFGEVKAQAELPPADLGAATDLPPDAVADVPPADAGCTAAGCPCIDNQQCDSAFCIETDGGQQCAKLCSETCPTGFKCGQVTGNGGDIVNLCVPTHPRLCEPCTADSDCSNVLGGGASRCMPYENADGSTLGAFCGAGCSDTNPCPSGYGCKAGTSLSGSVGAQCVKDDLTCACDGRATDLLLWTACSLANDAGTCAGKRSCGVSGLGECNAASALPEQCNLADDDCDGQTDEPSAGMCEDGKNCTYDNCVGGGCQHPPQTGPCDDLSACTTNDKCSDGDCVGAALGCDDKNPCTADACAVATGCTATADDAAPCSDASVCTVGDMCLGGACLPGAPSACNDDNPCTTDSCDGTAGCVFAANSLPCTDGDACTLGDGCKNKACATTGKLACSDGNPCTDDSCEAKAGCQFADNTASCSDGDVCTLDDICKAGVCLAGGAKGCDDGKLCTTESCDAKKGCVVVNNNAPCSDGNLCTVSDTCAGGVCANGTPMNCEDGNGCTTDLCDASQGCVPVSNAEPCSDNNACTEADACSGGKCAPGKGKICDDGNPCTNDACDPGKGCVASANEVACTDGDACTTGDTCSGGVCAGGSAPNCDDANACTSDSCAKAGGCQHAANAEACDDGNACTVSDSCKNTLCTAGSAKACDDGNPCTTDTCDGATGCLQPLAANGTACGDGTCKAGTCTCPAGFSGNGISCVDIDECLTDNGGCSTNGICSNTAGSNTCACKSGYTGDGKTCTTAACSGTWNPAAAGPAIVFSNGNKTIKSSESWNAARGTVGHSAGKWYFEVLATVDGNGFNFIGAGTSAAVLNGCCTGNTGSWGYYGGPGNLRGLGVNASPGGTAYANGSFVIGVAVDLDLHRIWWSRNGVWQASGNPATGASPTFSNLSGTVFPMSSVALTGSTSTLRTCAGQITGAVPSGFQPWE